MDHSRRGSVMATATYRVATTERLARRQPLKSERWSRLSGCGGSDRSWTRSLCRRSRRPARRGVDCGGSCSTIQRRLLDVRYDQLRLHGLVRGVGLRLSLEREGHEWTTLNANDVEASLAVHYYPVVAISAAKQGKKEAPPQEGSGVRTRRIAHGAEASSCYATAAGPRGSRRAAIPWLK
jgi:hypothetical protein